MASLIASFALAFGRVLLSTLISWFVKVYEAIGMTEVWIGAITFAIVFSIILVPLRGGGDIGKGSFGGLLNNKVNKTKGNSKKSGSKGG